MARWGNLDNQPIIGQRSATDAGTRTRHFRATRFRHVPLRMQLWRFAAHGPVLVSARESIRASNVYSASPVALFYSKTRMGTHANRPHALPCRSGDQQLNTDPGAGTCSEIPWTSATMPPAPYRIIGHLR